jgi:signal transduction histidine kinase
MVERLKRWLNPFPDTPGALRLGFAAAYAGVVGALLVYTNFVSTCNQGVPSLGWWTMIGLLALLLVVERYELTRERQPVSRRLAVVLLLARALLVQGVVMLDCTGLAVILYPIVPFAAFFALGAQVAPLIGLAYWLAIVVRAWLTSSTQMQTGIDEITIVVVYTLLSIFIMLIARNIEREDRSRNDTRQLLLKLRSSHSQLQAYAAQVAELAAAEERYRLARDIHDSVGHHLTAINIQLEKAIAFRQRNSAEADQAILDAKKAAEQALRDVRQSVGGLRSADGDFSLKQALADLVSRIDSETLAIDLLVEGDETGYARPVLTTLYRVAQEGLTNVQKHAGAQHVTLDVHLGAEGASLRLHDDGGGFQLDPLSLVSSVSNGSYGLVGLQERLELVRGQMTIASDPQQGTELTVTVPRNPARLELSGAL